ncbi:RDD family protein [Mycobacterium spongiae]|uniref:RDD family protein n=1 Tax=Mycobacterium spongiae TaxID=886343 RepID=A0A975PV98_9MYCO|nr:RDD family protein [Mycobacterium spongiae]QUR65936.1 RDD family protein [Mycobacterium spongiae]
MTVVVEKTQTTLALDAAPQTDLAPWHLRAAAFAVDVVPGIAVVATMALTALTVPQRSTWWFVCTSIAGLTILLLPVNRMLLPAVTGWSLGRALTSIRVVVRDGSSSGPWRLLLRDLAHLLDVLSLFVGWLWPLWDSRRRTFADMLARTEVRRVQPVERPQLVRRLVAAVSVAAAAACVGGAVVGAAVVYLNEWGTEQTRAQLQLRGPKIVVDMLSYDPETVQSDFEHARSLATERYRPQLSIQQDAVQESGAVFNQYWVSDSAVLAATPDHATMLLFMQGERGTPPNQRYITATVRVVFEKSGGQWRVDDLAVVMKPRQPEGEK